MKTFLALSLVAAFLLFAPARPLWGQGEETSVDDDSLVRSFAAWVGADDFEGAAEGDVTLLDLVLKMGFFVYPLGAFSLWAVYLILANLFVLSEGRLAPRRVAERVEHLLRTGMVEEAADYVERRGDLLSLMVQAGIGKAGRDPGLIETAMEGSISREMVALRNRIRRLADIGNLAPMLGLLGTVWGMVRVFKEISLDSTAMVANWSSALADGVAQAMLTTVAGLVIGIPALFFYYLYRNKMAKIVGRLESLGTDIADLLSAQRAGRRIEEGETVILGTRR